jgi:hypothetical protein
VRLSRAASLLLVVTGCRQILALEDFHRDDAAIDAAIDAPKVSISGKVRENNQTNIADATVTFVTETGTDVATATSDSIGGYALSVEAGTVGHLRAAAAGTETCYQYLPFDLVADQTVTVIVFTPAYIEQLAQGLVTLANSAGFILVQVRDQGLDAIADATIDLHPRNDFYYAGPNGADAALTATDSGGLGLDFNAQAGTTTLTATAGARSGTRSVTVVGGAMVLVPLIVR